jgi:hypothetical protein
MHDLSVELIPAQKRLKGEDQITLVLTGDRQVRVYLRPELTVHSLTWNGRSVSPTRMGGELLLTLTGEGQGKLGIVYEGVFDDPYQARPPTMDNPGQGVLGTISGEGAFLLPGSGWYPQINSSESSYRVRVTAPEGMHAVTLGRLERFAVEGGKSVTEWTAEHPTRGLPLSAGPYALRSIQEGGIAIQTFLFPGTRELAPVYLRASAEHVRFYSELHGPYPFPKFAVVENFFPTGFGFPSFTLLGTEVLKLPFIPATSLKHEVAHCWWGNGVLVDYSRGNWSEGLTTYVADYLSRELESEAEGREYRTQVLRDFALLAHGQDFPLSRFVSRTDPGSRAVGYGKAMFVFHMARSMAGEDAFWDGLRSVYRDKLFEEASWDDFREAFVRQGGWNRSEAERFWKQWVHRAGAPVLSLDRVDITAETQGWRVRATLRQEGEPYSLQIPVVLQSEGGKIERTLHVEGPEHPFELTSKGRPTRLLIDPDHHVFRLLSPIEVPATVNSLKGSVSLVGVLSEGWEGMEPVLRALLVSLGHSGAPVARERTLAPGVLQGRDLLVLGEPKGRPGMPQPPKKPAIVPENGVEQAPMGKNRSLFLIAGHPEVSAPVAAFFLPAKGVETQTLTRAVRKITHYGKYSSLVFDGDTVVGKSLSEPLDSPLSVDLTGANPRSRQ